MTTREPNGRIPEPPRGVGDVAGNGDGRRVPQRDHCPPAGGTWEPQNVEDRWSLLSDAATDLRRTLVVELDLRSRLFAVAYAAGQMFAVDPDDEAGGKASLDALYESLMALKEYIG